MEMISGSLALLLAVVHLFASRLRFLSVTPRSRWLSLGGGISVAYVFVHLLPELHEGQETLQKTWTSLSFLEAHAYLIALVGLALFYGLERAARLSRHQHQRTEGKDHAGTGVFWLHMASFGLYNALIGYLLHQQEFRALRGLFFFAFAIGIHFLINDYGLREHHKSRYDRKGRWILAAAIIIGWALGLRAQLPEPVLAVLFAFLAGGVVLNVLKEELPEERESRFWPFLAGAAAYSLLLLMGS